MSLSLIVDNDRDEESEKLSPPEKFFKSLGATFRKMVNPDKEGKITTASHKRIDLEKRLSIKAILELLEEKAFQSMFPSADKLDTIGDEDMVVVIYHDFQQAGWFVSVLEKSEYLSEWEKYEGNQIFLFKSSGYLFSDPNPYLGMNYHQIEQMVINKYGALTFAGALPEELCDFHEAVELCRSLLYGNLDEVQKAKKSVRLKELLLTRGDITRALIADFDRDYRDNEGWEKS